MVTISFGATRQQTESWQVCNYSTRCWAQVYKSSTLTTWDLGVWVTKSVENHLRLGSIDTWVRLFSSLIAELGGVELLKRRMMRERERERESEKHQCWECFFFFLILITIGLPLYHVSLILYKMRENRRLINGRGASPLTRCDKTIISNGDLLYEEWLHMTKNDDSQVPMKEENVTFSDGSI